MDRDGPAGPGDMLKWMWQRFRGDIPPDPPPEAFPRAAPDPARPRIPGEGDGLRVTWVGHATFLLQLPGVNLLTDPVFSRRASPVQWAGPVRLTAPGLTLDDLPPIDGVLLSHDHYDHLDRPSVKGLHERFGEDLTWFTPLGYTRWFERLGVRRVAELDWWQSASLETEAGGRLGLRALPARHWTRRRLRDAGRRLWCSWSIGSEGHRVYFGGDSAYAPCFAAIAEREAPFDVALLPVGAYEPRWFMRSNHMNPEEAVQASRDLRARSMVGMHWGTFRLTDEDPLEPPERTRAAWSAVGLAAHDLHIPRHGETLHFQPTG